MTSCHTSLNIRSFSNSLFALYFIKSEEMRGKQIRQKRKKTNSFSSVFEYAHTYTLTILQVLEEQTVIINVFHLSYYNC